MGLAAADTDFLQPIRTELESFEGMLRQTVHNDFGPLSEAMEQILDAGGKRLRPAMVLLAAKLGRLDRLEDIFRAAMAIEFIHSATLIHDDLIDDAPTRRGLQTLHETLGPDAAIIIGDYYFAKGANLMAQVKNPEIDVLLSQTVMTICYGEMLQLTSQRKYDQTVEEYYAKIERKTATLLSASTFCGALLSGQPPGHVDALKRFGHQLGMAFQIADDILDYLSSEQEMGKPVGNDLRQGTVTLPFMLALQDADAGPALHQVLDRASLDGEDYGAIIQIVRDSRAIDQSYEHARAFSDRARALLQAFPASPARESLEELTRFVIRRKH